MNQQGDPQYERHRLELLEAVLPYGIAVLAAVSIVYGVAELYFSRTLIWADVATYYPPLLAVLGVGWILLRRPPANVPPWVILLSVDLAMNFLLCLRLRFPETTLSGTAFILGLKMVTFALYVPWSPRLQHLANFNALVVYGAALLWRASTEVIVIHQWTMPLIAAFLASLGCIRIDAQRRLLYERNLTLAASEKRLRESFVERDEQAAIAQTLVDAARAIGSTVERDALLQRLAESTARAVHADFSHVFLGNDDGSEFEMVAGWGDTPEQAEMLRALRYPRSVMERLIERVERDGLAQVGHASGVELMPQGVQMQHGITHGVFALLEIGGRPIGVLTAGFRGRMQPFGAREERIIRGIADIAALALTNARLVDELREANAVRSDFVANMSHELRTPLNVIIGYHEMLLGQEHGPLNPRQAEILARLRSNSLQLLDLVTSMLELSKLESRQIRLHPSAVDLAELVGAIEAEIRDSYPKPDVELRCTAEAGLPALWIDAVKLSVIVKSLVANAVKFTERGMVELCARRVEDDIEIVVADTGIGIAPEAHERIFEAFTQADATIAERFGGTGIGLNIVRRLVATLGGTITVESTVGRGSTFRVRLPLVAQALNVA